LWARRAYMLADEIGFANGLDVHAAQEVSP
jgi:hypothetical protein